MNRRPAVLVIAVTLLLSLWSGNARAGMVTFNSNTFGGDNADMVPGFFPQFDPALFGGNVRLYRVDLRLQAHAGGLLLILNSTNTPVDFTGDLGLSYGDDFYTKNVVLSIPASAPANGFDFGSFSDFLDVTLHLTPVAPFIGSGMIQDNGSLSVGTLGGPPGVTGLPINPFMSADVTVTYFYSTPEPSSWILLLFGVPFLALIAVRRHRTSQTCCYSVIHPPSL